MTRAPDILCIGSVLWDVIGRSASVMRQGSDVPGRITRLPGGVAMNIAMAAARFGLTPALLTAIGRDADLAKGTTLWGIGRDTTEAEIDRAIESFAAVTARLRSMTPAQ